MKREREEMREKSGEEESQTYRYMKIKPLIFIELLLYAQLWAISTPTTPWGMLKMKTLSL